MCCAASKFEELILAADHYLSTHTMWFRCKLAAQSCLTILFPFPCSSSTVVIVHITMGGASEVTSQYIILSIDVFTIEKFVIRKLPTITTIIHHHKQNE